MSQAIWTRDVLRSTAYRLAPRSALDAYLHMRMLVQARRLSNLATRSESAELWIDALLGSHFFRPLQRRAEFVRLWETVSAQRPAAVCEIGAAGGGTAFLFARAAAPDATIVSVDLNFRRAGRAALARFVRRGQRLVCVEGDSHQAGTHAAVKAALRGRPLDLLYIDGDHGYAGVAADFQTYVPLMRRGGLVVFHDIVPDYRARYGAETSSCAGGVPQFWGEVKAAHPGAVLEIVEDAGQDGFGIGILRWGDTPPERHN